MINTGRGIALGTIEPEHADKLQAWRNNQEIWKWCRQNDLISGRDQTKWIERQNDDASIKMYSIVDVNPGYTPKPVGVCGLTSIEMGSRRAEFSLYIAPEYQKMGCGKKALSTLLDHAFNDLGLNLVWGESFEGNHAMKLFKEIGFTEEGMRRQFYFKGGRFINAHLFSMLASEWALMCGSTNRAVTISNNAGVDWGQLGGQAIA